MQQDTLMALSIFSLGAVNNVVLRSHGHVSIFNGSKYLQFKGRKKCCVEPKSRSHDHMSIFFKQ